MFKAAWSWRCASDGANSGGMDGSLLLSRTVANFSHDVDRGWSAVQHAALLPATNIPTCFREGAALHQTSYCWLRAGHSCRCAFWPVKSMSSATFWTYAYHDAVRVASGPASLCFNFTVCANRKESSQLRSRDLQGC